MNRETEGGVEKVTVVIPNYNGIKYIKSCLEALYAQKEGTCEFRVLMVDNGSTDGSVELAKELFPQTEWIVLPENTGFCHAVNVGIQATDTPYVILLNNDTRVYDGFVDGLYHAIEKSPDIFSVSARMLMWDKPELLDDAGDRYCALGWAYARGKGRQAANYGKPAEIFSACGGAAIYKREVFDEIGLFDELHFAYLEDLDIGYRARIYGYRNRYEPTAKVLHFGSASTGSRYNMRKTELSSANNIYVIGKNMPILQWLWNMPFLCVGFFIKFLFFCKKGMGLLYLKGLRQGLRRCLSRQGRIHKVKFRLKHLKNYFAIQIQLYVKLVRIIMKS